MFDAAWVLSASAVTDILRGDTPVSMVPRPNSARFMCRDRRMFISFIWPKWFTTLCDVLEAPELAADPRFADAASIRANGDALISAIEARLAHRDASEWAELLAARGVPASPVCSVSEAAAWPQVRQRHLLDSLPTADGTGTQEIVGAGIVFGRDSPRLNGPVPALGEFTSDALKQAGYSEADIARFTASGAVVCG